MALLERVRPLGVEDLGQLEHPVEGTDRRVELGLEVAELGFDATAETLVGRVVERGSSSTSSLPSSSLGPAFAAFARRRGHGSFAEQVR
jgi:hypothetical protein